MVSAPEAKKKIHCWRLRFLEITQYYLEEGLFTSKLTKNLIVFNGEMIFTHIKQFNQLMAK